eukprot:TRINITY_DN47326_c0_g1_i1.p1 TRINITY_DN47326_c0_g1~~TRINITY_DN47326_c0_g1_i1.p1  ORF type:complete len:150 (+),score=40.16 TRINITY_DN47326_c0_g1_i1:44-451(+)
MSAERAAPKQAKVKWATWLLKNAVLPSMDVHMRYWGYKLRVDRWLELYHPTVQIGIAGAIGSALFLMALPFIASENDKWLLELIRNERELARQAGSSRADFVSSLNANQRIQESKVLRATSFIPVHQHPSEIPEE